MARPPAPTGAATARASSSTRRAGARRASCRPAAGSRASARRRRRAGCRSAFARCRSTASRCRPSSARPAPRSAQCQRYARHRRQLDEGGGCGSTGTSARARRRVAMLISKAAMAADRTVAIYSLPRLLGMLRATYDDDALLLAQRPDRPALLGRPAARRRRRVRAVVAVGAQAALHHHQHPLRGRPGGAGDDQPQATRSCARRSATARCRGCTRCAASRIR